MSIPAPAAGAGSQANGLPLFYTASAAANAGFGVVVVGYGLTSVSDTAGNTFTKLADAGPFSVWQAVVTVAIVGSTHQIQGNGAGGIWAYRIFTDWRPGGIDGSFSGSGTHGIGAVQTDEALTPSVDPPTCPDYAWLMLGGFYNSAGNGVPSANPKVQGSTAEPTGYTEGLTHTFSLSYKPAAVMNPALARVPANDSGKSVQWYAFAFRWQSVGCTPADTGDNGKRLRIAYTPLRHRLRAYVQDDGALKVDRYNDSWPPSVAATVTVETADCSGVDLLWRPDSVGELLYAMSGTVYQRYSRDQGRTWGVSDTVATGYDDGCQAIDYRRGLKVVGLYDEAGEDWYVSVGTWDETNDEWANWTTPALVVSGAKAGAGLTIRPDGIAELDTTTTGGTRQTHRCRSFSSTSSGIWA